MRWLVPSWPGPGTAQWTQGLHLEYIFLLRCHIGFLKGILHLLLNKTNQTNKKSNSGRMLPFANPSTIRSPVEGPQPCVDIWNLNFIALMKRKQFSSIYNNILVCRGSAGRALLSQVNTRGCLMGSEPGACNKSSSCEGEWRPCWRCPRTRLTGVVTVSLWNWNLCPNLGVRHDQICKQIYNFH